MIILDKKDFYPDESEVIFDYEEAPFCNAIYAFCQNVDDDTEPPFEEECGIGLINVMYKEKDKDRHPFGFQYYTEYDKDGNPSIEFKFIDREEKEGPSLIPDDIFDMQVVYIKKKRQEEQEEDRPMEYGFTVVVDASQKHRGNYQNGFIPFE